MSDIVENDIIDNIILRFTGIKKELGYKTTVITVDDNRSTPYEEDELPAINIIDGTIELTSVQLSCATYHTMDMYVDINIITANDDVLYIRNLINDVQKAIGVDVTWGGLAIDTTLVGIDRDIVDQQNNKIANAKIRIKITYRKKQWS